MNLFLLFQCALQKWMLISSTSIAKTVLTNARSRMVHFLCTFKQQQVSILSPERSIFI